MHLPFFIMPQREMKYLRREIKKEELPLNDKQFMDLMDEFQKYLEREKVFIQNPVRYAEVKHATEIAKELFQDYDIAIKDDPIQMGALILCIEGFDIVVQGEREIKLFTELISKANNFEIYPIGDERIKFSIVFADVLKRIS